MRGWGWGFVCEGEDYGTRTCACLSACGSPTSVCVCVREYECMYMRA